MSNCVKCGKNIEDGSTFCNWCGARQQKKPGKTKSRGNGQGTVYRSESGKWIACVTLGYFTAPDGTIKRRRRTKTFATKREAVAALPELHNVKEKPRDSITFGQLYEKWLPTHVAGKSTMDCYKAAFKYLEPVRFLPMRDIDVDDLQACIDDARDNQGRSKRTLENIRCVVGLVYKFGIPRGCVPDQLNLAEYLKVNTSDGPARRESFNDVQLAKIRQQIGITWGADYVYIMCYTGFRPREFLSLTPDNYDPVNQVLRGGGKTDAGRNRTVTLSPKIQPYMADIVARCKDGGVLFGHEDGTPYRLEYFGEYIFQRVLAAAGIDNPLVDLPGGVQRHKYTPHSCRHTFSTLMKRVDGADKDKLELIGHTSGEMLRYYQDVGLDDLRKITDAI